VSPDGRRIAVVVRGDDFHDVWLYEPGRNTWDRFTSEGNCEFPLWSPDGTRLVYNSDRSGSAVIEWRRLDHSGAGEAIVSSEWARRSFPFSWSPAAYWRLLPCARRKTSMCFGPAVAQPGAVCRRSVCRGGADVLS